jgi:hypothetical protein
VRAKIKDYLISRKQSYAKTFKGVYGERVLDDLAKFCRANNSTIHSDPRMEMVLQGRREVWLRIAAHLNMTDKEAWKHFNPNNGDLDG